MKEFGFRVKTERMKRNWTQEYFAELLGVDVRYISNIECGHQNVTLKTVEKVSKALEIKAFRIFDFE